MECKKAEISGRNSRRVRDEAPNLRAYTEEEFWASNKRYQDVEERRLKEWENYQRSHRSTEEQQSSRAFLDVSIGGVLAGRLIMELFEDFVPNTVRNFRALITGSCGMDPVLGIKLDYLGTHVQRVDHNRKLVVLGGLDSFNVSSTGAPVRDEGYRQRHTDRGLLTMMSQGPHTIKSVFGITLGPSPCLDFKQVVFGRVVDDFTLLDKLEALPIDNVGRPTIPAVVTFCGALTGLRPSGTWSLAKNTEENTADDNYVVEHKREQ